MKLIKRPLVIGERVICKSSGKILYSGIVITIPKTNHKKAYIEIETNLRVRSGHGNMHKWLVSRNSSYSTKKLTTWDGGFNREYSDGGWNGYGSPTGYIENEHTGGSFLYTEEVDSWKKEMERCLD